MEVDERLENIKNLYRELLLREADISGLDYYYNSEFDIPIIRTIIENSPERAHVVRVQERREYVMDFIEPVVAVMGLIPEDNISRVIEKFNSENVSTFLSIPTLLDSVRTKLETTEIKVVELGLPPDTMLSIADTKNSLLVIDEAINTGKVLVIGGFDSTSIAAGLMYLWYIGHDIDESSARILIESRVENAVIDDILFGPWHLNTAREMYSKER